MEQEEALRREDLRWRRSFVSVIVVFVSAGVSAALGWMDVAFFFATAGTVFGVFRLIELWFDRPKTS